jgi:hypothetical protein
MSNYFTHNGETHNGETHNVSEWARKAGMNRITLQQRLARGWTIDRALNMPIETHRDWNTRELMRAVGPALRTYKRQHQEAERALVASLKHYAQSFVMHVTANDMRTLGQPPEGTFKAPGGGRQLC